MLRSTHRWKSWKWPRIEELTTHEEKNPQGAEVAQSLGSSKARRDFLHQTITTLSRAQPVSHFPPPRGPRCDVSAPSPTSGSSFSLASWVLSKSSNSSKSGTSSFKLPVFVPLIPAGPVPAGRRIEVKHFWMRRCCHGLSCPSVHSFRMKYVNPRES